MPHRLDRDHRTLGRHLTRHLGRDQSLSPRLAALLDALRALEAPDVPSDEADRAERLIAAHLALRNTRQAIGDGYTEAGTWDARRAPPEGRWCDHGYRLRKRGDPAADAYVGEPYGLTERDILALADLIGDGWGVTVDARGALHFPGRTLTVRVARRPDAEPGHVPWSP
jgi:hypothetical protein